jgi:hypothetical protein
VRDGEENVGLYAGEICFILSAQRIYRVSIKSFPDYKHLLQRKLRGIQTFFFQNVTQGVFFTTNLSNGKKNMIFF